jgi:flagellin-like protein
MWRFKMFETIIDSDERGQVGIGTLIIFIAMVLVAAVAAGVLVNTSGLLQSQAQDTGADAQAQVSNQIDVVSATGVNSDDTDSDIESVEFVVKKSPGSDPIDLSQASIQYTSSSSSERLSYDTATLNETTFTTENIKGTTSGEILEQNGDRVKISIDLESVDTGLAEGTDARITFVDQSGASTVYGVNVPDVLTGEYVSV